MSNLPTPNHFYSGYIFDLDGTVYLGNALLPRAGETLLALRARGLRTIFVSNNPTHAREDYAAIALSWARANGRRSAIFSRAVAYGRSENFSIMTLFHSES